MNPYDVLEVLKNTPPELVRASYRRLSAKYHPDKKTGSREKFEEIKLAFDVLSDPKRRKRYDATGRVDNSPITPERIQIFMDQMMLNVIDAIREDGSSDDPMWDNIRDKMQLSIIASRAPLKNERHKLQRKLERCVRMLERFEPTVEFDPVGKALRVQKERLENEIRISDDAMELSIEAERVLKTYKYNVGPGQEGQVSPGPTFRPLLGGPHLRYVG